VLAGFCRQTFTCNRIVPPRAEGGSPGGGHHAYQQRGDRYLPRCFGEEKTVDRAVAHHVLQVSFEIGGIIIASAGSEFNICYVTGPGADLPVKSLSEIVYC